MSTLMVLNVTMNALTPTSKTCPSKAAVLHVEITRVGEKKRERDSAVSSTPGLPHNTRLLCLETHNDTFVLALSDRSSPTDTLARLP